MNESIEKIGDYLVKKQNEKVSERGGSVRADGESVHGVDSERERDSEDMRRQQRVERVGE